PTGSELPFIDGSVVLSEKTAELLCVSAAVGALHPDAVPGRDAQQLGGLFAEDHAAVDEGQLAAGGAAEGEVLGHLLGAVGGHQGDAEVAGALAAVVDRDGAGV